MSVIHSLSKYSRKLLKHDGKLNKLNVALLSLHVIKHFHVYIPIFQYLTSIEIYFLSKFQNHMLIHM